MATTKRTLVINKAGTGQQGHSGDHEHFNLRKMVIGVLSLGCAVALVFGVLQLKPAAQGSPSTAAPTNLILSSDHGADSDNPRWCSQTAGPFACATTYATTTSGTDDFATNWCSQTPGSFACMTIPAPNWEQQERTQVAP
jgi:hypothetical protein